MTPLWDRFLAKIDAPDAAACWRWLGGTTTKGYGCISRGAASAGQMMAHRAAYELCVGPIPAGMQIDHLCRNPRCVNPAHLEPVTSRENTLRGESVVAQEARATRCHCGHEYTLDNTTINRQGWRICKTCQRDKWHHRQTRAREASR